MQLKAGDRLMLNIDFIMLIKIICVEMRGIWSLVFLNGEGHSTRITARDQPAALRFNSRFPVQGGIRQG